MAFNQGDIIHEFSGPGGTAQTGFSVTTAVSYSTLTQMAKAANNAFLVEMIPSMTVEWALERTLAYSDGAVGEWVARRVGDVVTPSSVNSTSLLVSKIPIQGHQGRLYLPGYSEQSILASGALVPNFQISMQGNVDDWLAELSLRALDMAMRRPNGTLDRVTRLTVKPYVGRQDRRLVRSRK